MPTHNFKVGDKFRVVSRAGGWICGQTARKDKLLAKRTIQVVAIIDTYDGEPRIRSSYPETNGWNSFTLNQISKVQKVTIIL